MVGKKTVWVTLFPQQYGREEHQTAQHLPTWIMETNSFLKLPVTSFS